MKKILAITSALLFTCAAAAAHADTVTYAVSIDTSSQKTNTGYIDLELNPSTLPTDDVMATVSGFSGAGLVPGAPGSDTSGVSGSLDTVLGFDNLSPTGSYDFEGVTFGDNVSFLVTLTGPGVGTSGPGFDSDTAFDVAFYDSTVTQALFGDEPGGSAVLIKVAADQAPDVETPGTTVAATPEPATLSLLALGGVAVGFARRWRTRVA